MGNRNSSTNSNTDELGGGQRLVVSLVAVGIAYGVLPDVYQRPRLLIALVCSCLAGWLLAPEGGQGVCPGSRDNSLTVMALIALGVFVLVVLVYLLRATR